MLGLISEVFKSIQGEGIYAGQEQLFVRFFGCNLNCKYCDTKLYQFEEYQPKELLEEIDSYNKSFQAISFTGGEPLLQKDFLKEILKLAHNAGYKTYLETNGTLWQGLIDVIDLVGIIAMDIKLPSSAGEGAFWEEHRRFLRIASAKEVFVKEVICEETQEEDFIKALELIQEVNKDVTLILQPNSFQEPQGLKVKLARFSFLAGKAKINARVIPQMHKILGVR